MTIDTLPREVDMTIRFISRALKSTLAILAVASALGGPLAAQTAPTAATSAPKLPDDTIVLNPFLVTTSTEDGWGGSASNVATGFNRDLAHTPLTVNVISEEFIRESGVTSYAQLNDFLPNTYIVPDPTGLGSTSIARGQGTSYYAQDGNRFYTEPILRAGFRVEVIKGPATLFFGRAQPGGIINFITRPASGRRSNSLAVSYNSFGATNVDIGSQGSIYKTAEGRSLLDYRVDASWQDGPIFVKDGRDRYKQLRTTFSAHPFRTVTSNFTFEYSYRQNTASIGAVFALSPQYYLDYKAPRAEQLLWARSHGAGATATDAQAITFLQNRWRENDTTWSNDTAAAFQTVLKPIRRIGLYALDGWDWNPIGGGYTNQIVYRYGSETTWVPNNHVALKFSWLGYNLHRDRYFMSAPNPLNGDGMYRFGNPAQAVQTNDDNTATLTALFNYSTGPVDHTTNIGITRYKDFFESRGGAAVALNSIAGVKDIRSGGTSVLTPGWDPNMPTSFSVWDYISLKAKDNPVRGLAHNREDAYYVSHIAEFFNHRLGLLTGARYQKFDTFSETKPAGTRGLEYNVGKWVSTVGLSWEIRPDLVFFASDSTSFEPSGGSLLNAATGNAQLTLAEQAKYPAPPSWGGGYDIGIKFSAGSNLSLSLAYFRLARHNDFATTDTARTNADPRNNDADATNDVKWRTAGGTRLSQGVDLQVNYKLSKNAQGLVTFGWLPVAKITENPTQQNNLVTLSDGSIGIDPNVDNAVGLRQANAPVYKVATFNSYRIESGSLKNLTIGAGFIYTSSVAVTTNRTTPVYAPGFGTVRLTLSYPVKIFGTKVDTQLVGSNIFDRKYFRSSQRGEPASVGLNLRTEF